jgi:hypothetical protein
MILFITTRAGIVHGGPNVHRCPRGSDDTVRRRSVTDKQIQVYGLVGCDNCFPGDALELALRKHRQRAGAV